ncbi:MAG: hypothetical protein ACYC9S_10290 [Leptospirales bacterium]
MIKKIGFRRDFFGVSFMSRILGRGAEGVKRFLFFCFFLGLPLTAFSGCQSSGSTVQSVDLADESPTPIHFDANPVPTLLPRSNLYLFLSSDRPLYYSTGQYFQNWHSHWFAAGDLRGPWSPVTTDDIPDLLRNVPPDYYYDNFPYRLRKEK